MTESIRFIELTNLFIYENQMKWEKYQGIVCVTVFVSYKTMEPSVKVSVTIVCDQMRFSQLYIENNCNMKH